MRHAPTTLATQRLFCLRQEQHRTKNNVVDHLSKIVKEGSSLEKQMIQKFLKVQKVSSTSRWTGQKRILSLGLRRKYQSLLWSQLCFGRQIRLLSVPASHQQSSIEEEVGLVGCSTVRWWQMVRFRMVIWKTSSSSPSPLDPFTFTVNLAPSGEGEGGSIGRGGGRRGGFPGEGGSQGEVFGEWRGSQEEGCLKGGGLPGGGLVGGGGFSREEGRRVVSGGRGSLAGRRGISGERRRRSPAMIVKCAPFPPSLSLRAPGLGEVLAPRSLPSPAGQKQNSPCLCEGVAGRSSHKHGLPTLVLTCDVRQQPQHTTTTMNNRKQPFMDSPVQRWSTRSRTCRADRLRLVVECHSQQ